jgi:hypothetical protein
MSRAYSVKQVQATAKVQGSDALALSLCLLDILDAGEMAALLREELAAAGWVANDAGALQTTLENGAEVTLSDDATEVVARLAHTREAAVRAREESRAAARAAQELDAVEPGLRAAVGEVVQRVYVRALKLRAARMGAVESVDERVGADGELELTIKVRV